MAFEALNHAGHLGPKLIVVLNDNGMSISPTVGALAKLLSRVKFDQRIRSAKRRGIKIINALPMGKKVSRLSQKIEERFKGILAPTPIWEALGITYIGPIDGHNLNDLERVFHQARDNGVELESLEVMRQLAKSLVQLAPQTLQDLWLGSPLSGWLGENRPDTPHPADRAFDAAAVPRAAQIPAGKEHQVRAHRIGAITLDQIIRRDDVAATLGHLLGILAQDNALVA